MRRRMFKRFRQISKAESSLIIFWRRFKKDKAGLVGLFIIGVIAFMAFFAPFLAPYDPNAIFYYTLRGSPSNEHPLGLDHWGHDVLSRIIWGSRTALIVAWVSVGIMLVIGILIGTVSGYYKGRRGTVFSTLIDAFLVLPFLLFIIITVKTLDVMLPGTVFAISGYREIVIIIMLGLFGWASMARIIRAQFIKLREAQFVEAARCLGASERRIIFRHILPNALPSIIVVATLNMALAILWESGISFLGFGDPSIPSWGFMLSLSLTDLPNAWWEALYPGLMIFLSVLGFNLLGDGLSEALNPRLREG
jgi:ABC-type dipeptide/oligopeptide/nickel transport system permease subunit